MGNRCFPAWMLPDRDAWTSMLFSASGLLFLANIQPAAFAPGLCLKTWLKAESGEASTLPEPHDESAHAAIDR
jgi:hypothetical protein